METQKSHRYLKLLKSMNSRYRNNYVGDNPTVCYTSNDRKLRLPLSNRLLIPTIFYMADLKKKSFDVEVDARKTSTKEVLHTD